MKQLLIEGTPDMRLLFHGAESDKEEENLIAFYQDEFSFLITKNLIFRRWRTYPLANDAWTAMAFAGDFSLLGYWKLSITVLDFEKALSIEQFKRWFLHWYKPEQWDAVQAIIDTLEEDLDITQGEKDWHQRQEKLRLAEGRNP